MSSSSFFIWTCLCVSNCFLHLVSSVELTLKSLIVVVIFFFRLKLSLCLALNFSFFSWTHLYIPSWCLHLPSSVELIFIFSVDVFTSFVQLNKPSYMSNWCNHLSYLADLTFVFQLMSSSSNSLFIWTDLCVSNWCLHLFSVELTFISRNDVFTFVLQFILHLCFQLMPSSSFFSWTCLCISNWYLHLLSSIELAFLSRVASFIFCHQMNLPLFLEFMS